MLGPQIHWLVGLCLAVQLLADQVAHCYYVIVCKAKVGYLACLWPDTEPWAAERTKADE